MNGKLIPFAPWCDGQTEHANRLIEDVLRQFVSEHLHQICFTTSTHSASHTHSYRSPSGRYGRNATARMAKTG